MNINFAGNMQAFMEFQKIQRAKVVNGNPELIIGDATPLVLPFKYNINAATKLITDMTEEAPLTTMTTALTATTLSATVSTVEIKTENKEVT